MFRNWIVAATVCATVAMGSLAQAAEKGPVTNLPMPRFVSMKVSEGNARRGPSLTHRIDWVYKKRGVPLQIIAEHGHWRRVRDRDGAGGWLHYSLLSGVRTVIVEQDMKPLRARPLDNAPISAQLRMGVVAYLGECSAKWCRLEAGGFKGWATKDGLWGIDPDEVRD